MSRRLRAFKRWMRSHVIDFSDALDLTFSAADGIYVRALCHLAAGDLVATIPKLSCLTVKTSGAREMIEEAGLEVSLALAVAIMFERSLGPASPWDGYLQLLPEREEVPLVWSLEEVDRLLVGTELHKIVREDKLFVHEDWREHIEPLVLSESLKLEPKDFGVEQYFSAKTLVSSRSFQVDDYHGYGMVPLADLLNHKTGAENVHFTSVSSSSSSDDEDDGKIMNVSDEDKSSIENFSSSSSGNDSPALEMIVVREVEAGNEVFNTYGTMGNAALLHRYGFTEPDNTYDIVNIDLNLVLKLLSSSFSNRYSRARVSLWRRLHYSGCTGQNSEYFEISFDGEPQLELLVLLYISFLSEDVYEKLNCMMDDFKEFNEAKSLNKLIDITQRRSHIQEIDKELLLTKNVSNALLSLASMRESFYGSNSLEEDVKKLRKCCRLKERKLHHSLVLRISERNILARLREYASRCSKSKKRKACKD